MAGMPTIQVQFKQLATSLVERSERGIAILIVKDNTNSEISYLALKDATELETYTDKFTSDNLRLIKDTLVYAPYITYVIRMNTDNFTVGSRSAKNTQDTEERASTQKITLANAINTIKEITNTGWVTVVDGTASDFESLISFVKSQEQNGRTYKAVVHKSNAPDSMRVVNFSNDTVTFADNRGSVSGLKYLPSLVGIFASANVKRGTTYYHCSNLTKVTEVEDNNQAISQGKFILFNDEGLVKIALGNNSLTTTNGSTQTESMKFIDVVETMDLIQDDIRRTFKDTYIGKYTNTYSNQMLLVSSIINYFKGLEDEDILDREYKNFCYIDASAIKNAWVGSGKEEASNWIDDYAKTQAFKRNVYLKADIKIVETMENLSFSVELF